MNIEQNLLQIRRRIVAAEQKYQREPGSVKLLAVSKKQGAEKIRQAHSLGQQAFGENFLQEAQTKISELSDLAIEWHFIGAIQSNKTKLIAQQFAWAHSLSRLKVAERLNEQRPNFLPPLNVCIEVNVGQEEGKSGIDAFEVLDFAREIAQLPRLSLRGLMAIPPKVDDFEEQIHFFRIASALQQRLNEQGFKLDTLSMGMSADLEAAIAAGSTMVRIGTALFGSRS